VHEIRATETASILEAALLETDEIKRIDPPYNVQLRSGERAAWFASRDLRDTVASPDALHRVGPLPSARALFPLAALRALAAGDDSPGMRAGALAVPIAELPDDALFVEGYRVFCQEHYDAALEPARRVERASRKLWLARGRKEPEVEAAEDAPLWDLARVRRRLERGLVQAGLLQRRTRWLRMLGEADIAYRERGMDKPRALIVERGELVALRDLESLSFEALPARKPHVLRTTSYDAASYDRLRVLATELRRVQDDGGELALRFGGHAFYGARLDALLRMV
jgi:DNA polymerase-3 subunit epsilon